MKRYIKSATTRLKQNHWYSFNDRGQTYIGQYTGKEDGFECCVCGKGCRASTFNVYYSKDGYETWGYGPNHMPTNIVEVADNTSDVIIGE